MTLADFRFSFSFAQKTVYHCLCECVSLAVCALQKLCEMLISVIKLINNNIECRTKRSGREVFTH